LNPSVASAREMEIQLKVWAGKIDQFKAAGSDSRAGLRTDLESAWKDLEDAFREMNLEGV